MTALVIDASVAIKWVVTEDGAEEAERLLASGVRLLAPDLILAECANILWKKVTRGEMPPQAAGQAALVLQTTDFELSPMRQHVALACAIAIELAHPAYDCMYLAVAQAFEAPFVTADTRLVRKLGLRPRFAARVLTLVEAAEMFAR